MSFVAGIIFGVCLVVFGRFAVKVAKLSALRYMRELLKEAKE